MTISQSLLGQSLLGEFDHEMANARKTIERVPDEKFDWKPHPKSMTMGALAAHIAIISDWAKSIVETPNFDVQPPDGQPWRPPELKTCAEVLTFFDQGVPKARAAIAAASDQSMMTPWSLLSGGKPVFTMPRVAVLRSFVMNHMIHHRAQLGVYLRINDVPLPALYGPSADEGRI